MPEPKDTVLVRTFATEATAQLAARRLEAADIPCLLASDDGGGTIPALTTVRGVRLLVAPSDLDAAEQLLRDIEHPGLVSESPAEPDTTPPPRSQTRPATSAEGARPERSRRGFWLGLIVGVAVSGFVFGLYEIRQRTYTGVEEYDLNDDGRPDAWWIYRKGQCERIEQDRNYDGKPDSWDFYPEGEHSQTQTDDDFDGKPDGWHAYTNDVVSESKLDVDSNGRPDVTYRYKAGVVTEAAWTGGEGSIVLHRQVFQDGVLHESFIDKDGDGVFDEKVEYDAFAVPIRTLSLKLLSAPAR
ncbi:MAG: DUF2007 domain-containing protein [Verrucomicrobia bacterium]|nr:DUF2007 domain-containing protein [Verrucomicrobiota bacterium]